MTRSVRSVLLASLALAAVAGCVPQQHVRYDVSEVARSGAAAGATLDVGVLVDVRAEVPENAILFGRNRLVKVDGKKLCVNSEALYEPGTVARQVSESIRAHLEKRGAFRSVSVGGGTGSLRLEGKLRRLYGTQVPTSARSVGGLFGAVGALVALTVKSPVSIRIELTDLVLARNDGTVVTRLPDVSEAFDGELRADGKCFEVYGHVNDRLRAAIERLAGAVEQAAAPPGVGGAR